MPDYYIWSRQRALVVSDKAERVYNFHNSTIEALAELVAAMGLNHPKEISPHHLSRRVSGEEIHSFHELYPPLQQGELLTGTEDKRFKKAWEISRADTFAPVC